MKVLKRMAPFLCVICMCLMGCMDNKSELTEVSLKNQYHRWVHEVETSGGNVQGVLNLYADDAILLPTLSPKICTNKKMLADYFNHFLNLQSLKVETKELITRRYGDIGMNTGYYNISYMNGNKKEIIKARFDFWYRNVDGKWEIIFHQSSVLPKE